MKSKIIEILSESDSTFEMIYTNSLFTEAFDDSQLLKELKSLMRYGTISQNKKVIMYAKAGFLWFGIRKRKKRINK